MHASARSKAPVAIVAALRAELRPLEDALSDRRQIRSDGQRFTIGELDGRRSLLTATGVGARAAVAGAVRSIQHLELLGLRDASVAIVGVAGGLSPAARLGEVFSFRRCLRFDEHDRETGRLELAAAETGAAEVAGPELVTVDRMLLDPADKAKLWGLLGKPAAAAVDMETYYAAERFASAGHQVFAVRAISDGPDDALPAWLAECATPSGGLSQAKVALRALGRPTSIPVLLDLRRRVQFASRRLCATVRELVRNLD